MPVLTVISISRVQACICTVVLLHSLATADKYVNMFHRNANNHIIVTKPTI